MSATSIFQCRKWDEDRIPSTCDFKTSSGIAILDHIGTAHSSFYCHMCDFKSKHKNEIEDHDHYQELIDDISRCEICGEKIIDKFERCDYCINNEDNFIEVNSSFKCDICTFETKYEHEFNKHQDYESDRLASIAKHNLRNVKSGFLYLQQLKINISAKTWFSYFENQEFQNVYEAMGIDEKIDEVIKAMTEESQRTNPRMSVFTLLNKELDLLKEEYFQSFSVDKDKDLEDLNNITKKNNSKYENYCHDKDSNNIEESVLIDELIETKYNGKLKSVAGEKPELLENLVKNNTEIIVAEEEDPVWFEDQFKKDSDSYTRPVKNNNIVKVDFMEYVAQSTENIVALNDIKCNSEKYCNNEMNNGNKEEHVLNDDCNQNEEFADQITDFKLKDYKEINFIQCDICNIGIEHNTTLEKHKKVDHENKCYHCDFCEYKSISEFNMWCHNKILHIKDQIDNSLSDTFYEQNIEPAIIQLFNQHNIYSDEINMENKTKIEDIEFDDALLTSIFNKEEIIATIEGVNVVAYSTENLSASIKQEIDELKLCEEDNKNSFKVSEISNSYNEVKQINITNDQCKIMLYSKQILKTNPQLVCNCLQCLEKFVTNFQIKSQFSPQETISSCVKCDLLFDSKSHLKPHILCLHEGNTFSCKKCESVFNTKFCFKRHTHSLHKATKSVDNQCDMKFDSKFQSKYHMQFINQSELKHVMETYICYQCGSLFLEKKILKEHIQYIHEMKSKDQYKRIYEEKKNFRMEEINLNQIINIHNINRVRSRLKRRKKIKALGRKRKRRKKLEEIC